MKKSKFTEEQIAFALKQAETRTQDTGPGSRLEDGDHRDDLLSLEAELWWAGDDGVPSAEPARGREPETEIDGGRPVARQGHAPGSDLKRHLKTAKERSHVRCLEDQYRVSERRVALVVGIWRSRLSYQSTRPDQAALRKRIREIAETRVRCGCRRIYILLRGESWKVNHERLYRLYREEDLNPRRKRPRRRVTGSRREGRSE